MIIDNKIIPVKIEVKVFSDIAGINLLNNKLIAIAPMT